MTTADDLLPAAYFFTSAIYTLTIMSGSWTGRSRVAALDLVDVLHAVDHLAPHRVLAGQGRQPVMKQMKNWLLALLGSLVRAAPTVPRL